MHLTRFSSHIICLASILFTGFSSLAQKDFSLYHMPAIPQRNIINPAFNAEGTFHIGIPALSSIQMGIYNSGFSYSDLIRKTPDDSLKFDEDRFLNSLAKKNTLSQDMDLELISGGFNLGKNYFNFSIREKQEFHFFYPKDFFTFILQLNGEDLLGRRADMGGLGFDFTHYREYAVGYSRELSDKYRVGGKLKLLYGKSNVWTKTSELGLTTDDTTFFWRIDGKFELLTSGFPEIEVNDSNKSKTDIEPIDYILNRANTGVAIDAGVTYIFNDKLTLSASIIDIGYIDWKDKVYDYKSKDIGFDFKGIPLDSLIDVDTLSNGKTKFNDKFFDNFADSLKTFLELDQNSDSYVKMLTAKMYFAGEYKINHFSTAGAVVHMNFVKSKIKPGVSLSYNFRFRHWLSASGTYTIYGRSYANIGLGLAVNGGPFQWYIVTDNMLSPFLPHAFKAAHIRTGFNLTFGRNKKQSTTAPKLEQDGL